MQYTTNYNLITVEGTDVVNPLVQMNPNFTDIDAAMFANKQATIGSAAEIVSGTVHAITRSNTDSDYFRFTATGNWTLGDSMSVDGVSVSVFLSDGTTPGTGAYIINTEVLALLSGTRVTLITSSGAVAANAVSYDNTGSGLTATNVQDAIDELAPKGSVTVTADGVKTYAQLISELYAAVDITKINLNSKILAGSNVLSLVIVASGVYKFALCNIASQLPSITTIGLHNSSYDIYANGAYASIANQVPAVGVTLELVY